MVHQPHIRHRYVKYSETVKCQYCNKLMHRTATYRHNKICVYFGMAKSKRPTERLVDSIFVTFE